MTEFILLISEHFSNRIVSDVKHSPCWASMVDETANIAAMCCPFHLPQPEQSKDFQLCAVLKLRNETGCLLLIVWDTAGKFQELYILLETNFHQLQKEAWMQTKVFFCAHE